MENDCKYLCEWFEPEYTDNSDVNGFDFFSDSNGYEESDRDKVSDLCLHESTYLGCHPLFGGKGHKVTRVY